MNNFDPLTKHVFNVLLAVFSNHKRLAEDGKLRDRQNRFGDMALRADIEAEEIILSSLKEYVKDSKAKLIYRGEELGEGEVNGENGALFVVFDGLDGSNNYLKKSDYGYGTMIAVSKNENPKYNDFIIAGLVMMEEGKIVIAVKNKGVYVYDVESEKIIQIDNFDKMDEFDNSKILANKYFSEELRAYGNTSWVMTGSTAWSIYSICTGDKFNGLIEVTRKGNLEQPIIYLMITTLGGIMIDKEGKSIGNYDFRTWGQDEKLFVITAKNKSVAEGILKTVYI